jgi:hypothetical protein
MWLKWNEVAQATVWLIKYLFCSYKLNNITRPFTGIVRNSENIIRHSYLGLQIMNQYERNLNLLKNNYNLLFNTEIFVLTTIAD